jgi:hypothetical protein
VNCARKGTITRKEIKVIEVQKIILLLGCINMIFSHYLLVTQSTSI